MCTIVKQQCVRFYLTIKSFILFVLFLGRSVAIEIRKEYQEDQELLQAQKIAFVVQKLKKDSIIFNEKIESLTKKRSFKKKTDQQKLQKLQNCTNLFLKHQKSDLQKFKMLEFGPLGKDAQ